MQAEITVINPETGEEHTMSPQNATDMVQHRGWKQVSVSRHLASGAVQVEETKDIKVAARTSPSNATVRDPVPAQKNVGSKSKFSSKTSAPATSSDEGDSQE